MSSGQAAGTLDSGSMSRNRFVRLLEGAVLNSQLAEHCDHQRGHVATEAEQDQLETEMRAYFDRRNDQMRQLHAWFDQTASRMSRADRIEAAARKVVKGWDEKDTMAIMLAIRDHLIPAFSSDNTVDDAGRREGGS